MPITTKQRGLTLLPDERIQFETSLSPSEIESLAANPTLRVLQTQSPIEKSTLALLNDRLFSVRKDVELRLFGFPTGDCDLSLLPQLGNLRRFTADSFLQLKGVEHLQSVGNLESLSIQSSGLTDFDFLNHVTEELENLSLGLTISSRPSLQLLPRFHRLKRLHIDRHNKGIEVVERLSSLEKLSLRSVTVSELGFLRKLRRLRSLEIKLGGISNLSALGGMNSIKYLELWKIRGLKDISAISLLGGLQFLYLQSLPNIHSLPDLSNLKHLRRIFLHDMNGLVEVRQAAKAPELEEFVHIDACTMEPDQYVELLRHKTLKEMAVGFGSEGKNNAFSNLMRQTNIKDYQRADFSFR